MNRPWKIERVSESRHLVYNQHDELAMTVRDKHLAEEIAKLLTALTRNPEPDFTGFLEAVGMLAYVARGGKFVSGH